MCIFTISFLVFNFASCELKITGYEIKRCTENYQSLNNSCYNRVVLDFYVDNNDTEQSLTATLPSKIQIFSETGHSWITKENINVTINIPSVEYEFAFMNKEIMKEGFEIVEDRTVQRANTVDCPIQNKSRSFKLSGKEMIMYEISQPLLKGNFNITISVCERNITLSTSFLKPVTSKTELNFSSNEVLLKMDSNLIDSQDHKGSEEWTGSLNNYIVGYIRSNISYEPLTFEELLEGRIFQSKAVWKNTELKRITGRLQNCEEAEGKIGMEEKCYLMRINCDLPEDAITSTHADYPKESFAAENITLKEYFSRNNITLDVSQDFNITSLLGKANHAPNFSFQLCIPLDALSLEDQNAEPVIESIGAMIGMQTEALDGRADIRGPKLVGFVDVLNKGKPHGVTVMADKCRLDERSPFDPERDAVGTCHSLSVEGGPITTYELGEGELHRFYFKVVESLGSKDNEGKSYMEGDIKGGKDKCDENVAEAAERVHCTVRVLQNGFEEDSREMWFADYLEFQKEVERNSTKSNAQRRIGSVSSTNKIVNTESDSNGESSYGQMPTKELLKYLSKSKKVDTILEDDAPASVKNAGFVWLSWLSRSTFTHPIQSAMPLFSKIKRSFSRATSLSSSQSKPFSEQSLPQHTSFLQLQHHSPNSDGKIDLNETECLTGGYYWNASELFCSICRKDEVWDSGTETCNGVNCNEKYHSTFLIFNVVTGMCEEQTVCMEGEEYNELTNLCEVVPNNPTPIVPDCSGHGKIVEGVTCECDDGWITTTEGLAQYLMCNTEKATPIDDSDGKTFRWDSINWTLIIFIVVCVVVGLLALWCLFRVGRACGCCTCCSNNKQKTVKVNEKEKKRKSSKVKRKIEDTKASVKKIKRVEDVAITQKQKKKLKLMEIEMKEAKESNEKQKLQDKQEKYAISKKSQRGGNKGKISVRTKPLNQGTYEEESDSFDDSSSDLTGTGSDSESDLNDEPYVEPNSNSETDRSRQMRTPKRNASQDSQRKLLQRTNTNKGKKGKKAKKAKKGKKRVSMNSTFSINDDLSSDIDEFSDDTENGDDEMGFANLTEELNSLGISDLNASEIASVCEMLESGLKQKSKNERESNTLKKKSKRIRKE
ncbi:uncharacterized protein MONOS_12089 [Monocercomonoides exilis]|uniref:uncharacterized protein n=1 Tax=Monocercomonoides exilis TaxID=2049356 RepID=UPI00355A28B9|nr:hypothetical protein MONOS_12089 [Monocercomonoides exilis]|eukprot:MONOS_12089.1-p1 / transcript=MONOS_12089.1 / gene=MONOS_12089 / organism=Monocercomonoides_exilis_PA203 / gene_product=unspecified product / transcript_product=unspecified product / location=Mono_scaffold00644:25054-28709(+) / protein_length=1114 / sequence_SO=supercontig / SO=protein_coding / is_pseudo=false